MIIENPTDFLAALPPYKQLLGLDVGSKTIGIAISDTTLTIATAIDTIKRKKLSLDINKLNDIIKQNSIAGLVIGLPISMDGTQGKACQSIRQFVRNVDKELDIVITFWDERLSTIAAERSLLEADISRARRAEIIDKTAAAIILQGFLDRIASS